MLLSKNPVLWKHFSHASCSKQTGFHQALPMGLPFITRLQRLSKQLPSNRQAQFRLHFEGPALSQDDYFKELCFEELSQSFSIYTGMQKKSLPTSERSHKADEVPQSTKREWMQQNCKWTVRKSKSFWQATNNGRYILPCGSCCCKAVCLWLPTARNTIKSSNCLQACSRKSS